MADFCNKCAYDMWGDHLPADIDVPKIFRELDEGFALTVMCEGCGLSAIGKNEGKLFTSKYRESWKEDNLSDYIIHKNKRVKLCQKSEK
jgi:hypothetical protein